jgi:hypothetical protein
MTTFTKRNPYRTLIWALPVAGLLIAAAGHGVMMLVPPPADLDLSWTQTSTNGSFVASIEPGSIKIGETATWTIEVASTGSEAIALEQITVDGGMPLHGHGLPTEPQVTRDLGGGRFEVENMKFSMTGWWVVNVHVETPAGKDQATFNLSL